MGNLHSCDWDDFTYAYRERIAISDGTIRCCESGILIPRDFPFADCRTGHWDCYTEEPPCEEPDELPTEELLPLLKLRPQALEVWRLLRNDSAKRMTCPSWGFAVQDYCDTWSDTGEQSDRLAYVKLLSTIKTTSQRYEKKLRPRLHPHERRSLESGEFTRALPYSLKDARK